MSDQDREDHPKSDKERRKLLYRVGKATGKQFRKDGAGRQIAKRVGGAVIRRGLFRFLR